MIPYADACFLRPLQMFDNGTKRRREIMAIHTMTSVEDWYSYQSITRIFQENVRNFIETYLKKRKLLRDDISGWLWYMEEKKI